MDNYLNNLYFNNFTGEYKEIFDLSEKLIFRKGAFNRSYVYIDSLGRFKIYNSLSFILTQDTLNPKHLLTKLILKHFKAYFNICPDYSNYYFYILGTLLKKVSNNTNNFEVFES